MIMGFGSSGKIAPLPTTIKDSNVSKRYRILKIQWLNTLVIFSTVLALVLDGIKLAFFLPNHNSVFWWIKCGIFIVFLIDITHLALLNAQGGNIQYFWSLYFFLDVISTVAVTPGVDTSFDSLALIGRFAKSFSSRHMNKAMKFLLAARISVVPIANKDTMSRRVIDVSNRKLFGFAMLIVFVTSFLWTTIEADVEHEEQLKLIHKASFYGNDEFVEKIIQSFAEDSGNLLYLDLFPFAQSKVMTMLESIQFYDSNGALLDPPNEHPTTGWTPSDMYTSRIEIEDKFWPEELTEHSYIECYSSEGVAKSGICPSRAVFDISKHAMEDAIFELLFVSIVIISILFTLLCFTRAIQKMLLSPLERMTTIIGEFVHQSSSPRGRERCNDGLFEPEALEKAVTDVKSLLQVSLGEAGRNIVTDNIGKSGKLDPMVRGKKVFALFCFCDIRDFTKATEYLQEDVMVFVNQVGDIVHGAVHSSGGYPNKNIGDAFLLVWKLPPEAQEILEQGMEFEEYLVEELKSRNHDTEHSTHPFNKPFNHNEDPRAKKILKHINHIADKALLAILQIMYRIDLCNRYGAFDVCDSNPSLQMAFDGKFSLKMGFGLHAGWAVEGAIGSKLKVDASYLSSHVNTASRLEAATKQYRVPILFSGQFFSLLSPCCRSRCRLIDRVTVKGSSQPTSVFTFDIASAYGVDENFGCLNDGFVRILQERCQTIDEEDMAIQSTEHDLYVKNRFQQHTPTTATGGEFSSDNNDYEEDEESSRGSHNSSHSAVIRTSSSVTPLSGSVQPSTYVTLKERRISQEGRNSTGNSKTIVSRMKRLSFALKRKFSVRDMEDTRPVKSLAQYDKSYNVFIPRFDQDVAFPDNIKPLFPFRVQGNHGGGGDTHSVASIASVVSWGVSSHLDVSEDSSDCFSANSADLNNPINTADLMPYKSTRLSTSKGLNISPIRIFRRKSAEGSGSSRLSISSIPSVDGGSPIPSITLNPTRSSLGTISPTLTPDNALNMRGFVSASPGVTNNVHQFSRTQVGSAMRASTGSPNSGTLHHGPQVNNRSSVRNKYKYTNSSLHITTNPNAPSIRKCFSMIPTRTSPSNSDNLRPNNRYNNNNNNTSSFKKNHSHNGSSHSLRKLRNDSNNSLKNLDNDGNNNPEDSFGISGTAINSLISERDSEMVSDDDDEKNLNNTSDSELVKQNSSNTMGYNNTTSSSNTGNSYLTVNKSRGTNISRPSNTNTSNMGSLGGVVPMKMDDSMIRVDSSRRSVRRGSVRRRASSGGMSIFSMPTDFLVPCMCGTTDDEEVGDEMCCIRLWKAWQPSRMDKMMVPWFKAMSQYIQGDWDACKKSLEQVLSIHSKDGPARTLFRYIQEHENTSVHSNWMGVRGLTEK
eukprot:TRINITY_DN5414_c0_g1_i1.p1 TRINITY_DN5414_c0_g1~~TRINITY_DN5414_c0_g1_i1.p1  ORF type:complete len:1377 (-),score=302.62 TRINITY_DN5414_c0_g1_i1:222-4352(-)